MLTLIMLSVAVEASIETAWNRFPWSEPKTQMENFFRRNPTMFIKTPQVHCECPPFKECEVEFKPNEDMIEFLHVRGIINETKAQEYKADLEQLSSTKQPIKARILAARRRMNRAATDEVEVDGEHCCCPPSSLMMPTFITDQKFDEVIGRVGKNKDDENGQ